MKIYWDMDDTLLDEGRLFFMAQKMVRHAAALGHENHVITFSIKERADKLIKFHYPNVFKSVLAREDYAVDLGCMPYSIYHDYAATETNKEPRALLIEDQEPSFFTCRVKMAYLGIDGSRMFKYDNCQSKMPILFAEWLSKQKE